MIIGIYSVYDRKSGVYNNPFTAVNDPVAMRVLHVGLTREPGVMSQYPEDFTLECVGTFNPETGEIVPEVNKFRPIAEVRDILKKEVPGL